MTPSQTPRKRHPLNYFYFGALFILVATLHTSHIFLVEEGTLLNRLFYVIYGVGQSLFEIGGLIFIGAWVFEKCPRFMRIVFIFATFLILLMHMIDFPLMRLMDMSIWYAIDFVLAESLENFIEMLKASTITSKAWLLFGSSILLLTLTAVWLYRMTDRFSSRKPIHFSYRSVSVFLFGIMGFLTIFDSQIARFAGAADDGKFLKALPWKTTFFTAPHPECSLSSSFPKKPSQQWYEEKLSGMELQALHKPNIYLFVVESLREDFLSPKNAPTLSSFREKNIAFPQAIASANATHFSWFSLFHGVYPFAWKDRQPKEWSLGSLPLHLLKKGGYQIHVLSASQFRYYQMNKVLFGKNQTVVDDYHVFPDKEGLENHAYDAECINHLISTMKQCPEGHLFIVFLEGTHFDYSWPAHLSLPSMPPAAGIDYFQMSFSKTDLEGVKNRYRHAIYHIDYQFDRFLYALEKHPKAKEAVVIFTSDHGEEFYEEGRLFHGSNLNSFQTHVPLYYRFGSNAPHIPARILTSHLDIFPTLLDYVFGETIESSWFDGESILRPAQKHFAVSARYNASRTPYEFLITTEQERLVARFQKRYDIRSSSSIEIISRKNFQEQKLSTSLTEIKPIYEPIFNQLCKHPKAP